MKISDFETNSDMRIVRPLYMLGLCRNGTLYIIHECRTWTMFNIRGLCKGGVTYFD